MTRRLKMGPTAGSDELAWSDRPVGRHPRAIALGLIGEHDQIDVRSQACSAVGVAVLTTAPSSAATSTRPPGLAIHNVHAGSSLVSGGQQ
ncbi:MAG TPA: hypothetical protein VNB87_16040 [Propionibacteriaceae bacterium]|jgi:hypothetical protein|nr:hypothetical protein [Propionibacteriaceae bacterium]